MEYVQIDMHLMDQLLTDDLVLYLEQSSMGMHYEESLPCPLFESIHPQAESHQLLLSFKNL